MSNRIAIVTGASRLNGIGRAVCVELAKRGIDIFFTYWRAYDKTMPWGVEDNEPEQIQQEILDLGVRCNKLEVDLMRNESAGILLDSVENSLGSPSILINNATYSTDTGLSTITPNELDKHYFVNVRAAIMLSVGFVNRFKEGLSGRIVNLTSGQTLSAMSGEIAYAVTKGAIETFTRTMQHELAAKRITINAVNPGLTDSGWRQSGWMDEKMQQIFLSRFPMGRYGKPTDVARLIGFLTSPEGEWITGQVIHSEGGFVRENYDS